MPHHSAQQRQLSSASSLPPSQAHSAAFAMSPSISFPPQTTGYVPTRQADYQTPLLQTHPGMSPCQHHFVPESSSWPAAANRIMVHRVGSHGDSDSASIMSGQSSSDHPHLTPIRRLSTSNSKSFDSPHGVAASVLLLAASKIKEDEDASATSKQVVTLSPKKSFDGVPPTTTSDDPSPSIPLKKRKNAADIMRKKPEETSSHAHVSPMSHGTNHSVSSPTSAATNSPDMARHSETTRSTSYELKDGQALPDSAKIIDTNEISCPPTHVEIPHFPSVLHAVLTESEFRDSVLQWLAHGQAWKIVRWDALRRQVLPKYFSQLREEKDASGSIDAFLWHLQAWGFEEITDGPDAGAYTNVLFRRELSQLCREMRFCPASESHGGKSSEKDERRTILQVPSLSSNGIDRGVGEEKKEDDYGQHSAVSPAWRSASMAYRPVNHMMPRHDVWNVYSPEPPHWINAPNHHDAIRAVPPYSPIQVRSSRGAARSAFPLTMMTHQRHHNNHAHPSHMSSPHDLSGGRISFPVSNRGRGGPAARRIIPTPIKAQAAKHVPVSVVPAAVVEAFKPRPILKRRKLPISARPSMDETLSDTEESCSSMGTDSKRSKLEVSNSNDTLDTTVVECQVVAATH